MKTTSFASFLRIFLLLPLALILVSCEESELFYLLNPDGSGRVTTKEKILTSEHGITGKEALETVATGTLAEIVLRTTGVDEWEKVSYTITASGDVEVEATALFPDLSKLALASTALSATLPTGLKFEKGDKEKGTLAAIQLASPISNIEKQRKTPVELEDNEITAELARARKFWADASKNIRPEYGDKFAKITFHLPGDIQSQSNFKKDAKNQVSLKVTAPQMIDTLEKIINDDELATEVLKSGAKLMSDAGAPPIKALDFNKVGFGEAKPIRVEYKLGPMIFDYAGAVDAAKANPSELLDRVKQIGKEQQEN